MDKEHPLQPDEQQEQGVSDQPGEEFFSQADALEESTAPTLADQPSDSLEEEGLDFFREVAGGDEEPAPQTEPEPLESPDLTEPGLNIQPEAEVPDATDEGIESHPEAVYREAIGRNVMGKHMWGLDVGTHSIKLVGLARGLRKTRLIHLGIVEISPQKELSREPSTKDVRANSVLLAMEKLDLERNSMMSAVSSTAVVIRQIQYPFTARHKLLSALRWETRRYIPFKPEEVVVDAQILSENPEAGKMEVLLTAVTKEHLSEHMGVLEQAGVKPLLMDAGPLSVFNSFMNNSKMLKAGETVVLLDVGASVSTLTIYALNGTFFTLALSIGGYRITREIQSRCHISYREAEDLKCRDDRGAANSAGDRFYYPMHEALQSAYEMLVNEIRQALIYYNKQTGVNKFDRLVLTGGGANLMELPDYLSRKLGMPAEILNPLEGFEIDPQKFNANTLRRLAPNFSLAVGLALRGDI